MTREENIRLRDDLVARRVEIQGKITELDRDADLASDPEEVALQRLLAPAGIAIILNRLERLAEAAKSLVQNASLKITYGEFRGEYCDVRERIIGFHHNIAFSEVENLLGPSTGSKDVESRHEAANSATRVTEAIERLGAGPSFFQVPLIPLPIHRAPTSDEIYRALVTPDTQTVIADVNAAISSLRLELEQVSDLTKLPPSERLLQQSRDASWQPTVHKLAPQPTALHDGLEFFAGANQLAAALRESAVRNAKLRAESGEMATKG